MTRYAAQLRDVPGLGTCSRADLARLARAAERVHVEAGGTVTGSRDRWTGSTIVERGEAVVRVGGWTFVLPPGARVLREDANACELDVVARSDVDALMVRRGYDRSISGLAV
jgi:hypothetical protein